jgi:hypothetical protein
MLTLSNRWAEALLSQPETGMGYQLVSLHLLDGRRFDGVTVSGGVVLSVPGYADIPFREEQIDRIVVTHDRTHAGSKV